MERHVQGEPEIMMEIHNIRYRIGARVYLVTDDQQQERIITKITLLPGGSVQYCLSLGSEEFWHFDIEFSNKRDVVKATSA